MFLSLVAWLAIALQGSSGVGGWKAGRGALPFPCDLQRTAMQVLREYASTHTQNSLLTQQRMFGVCREGQTSVETFNGLCKK
eukprot:4325486-Amphidinium_carterae.1